MPHEHALSEYIRDLEKTCGELQQDLDHARAEAYLAREAAAAAEAKVARNGEAHRRDLDELARLRRDLAAVHAGPGDVWRWQGDGHDEPGSLACPVVMHPETLRAILADRDAAQRAREGAIELIRDLESIETCGRMLREMVPILVRLVRAGVIDHDRSEDERELVALLAGAVDDPCSPACKSIDAHVATAVEQAQNAYAKLCEDYADADTLTTGGAFRHAGTTLAKAIRAYTPKRTLTLRDVLTFEQARADLLAAATQAAEPRDWLVLAVCISNRGTCCWWGPERMGYTEDLHEAGRYTEAEARACAEGTDGAHVAVPESAIGSRVPTLLSVRGEYRHTIVTLNAATAGGSTHG